MSHPTTTSTATPSNQTADKGYLEATAEMRDKLCPWDDEPGTTTGYRLSLLFHEWLDEMEDGTQAESARLAAALGIE